MNTLGKTITNFVGMAVVFAVLLVTANGLTKRLLGRRVDVVTERSLHPLMRERLLAGAVPL